MARRQPKLGLGTEVWGVRTYRQIYNTLGAVRDISVPERPLGCIVGSAGMGKTFTATSFRDNNPDVIIITVPPKDLLTPRALLCEFAYALGTAPGSAAKTADLYNRITDELTQRPYFVIVDEADRLRPSNADLIREVAEVTARPVCFLGCPGVLNVLDRVEATHHRVGIRYMVEALTVDDLLKSLLNKALDPKDAFTVRTLTAEVIGEIYELTRGNLRHIAALLNILRTSREQGSMTGLPLTQRNIRFANDRFLKRAA